MRLTVLGGCGAWPAAGQACSGYLLEQDGFRLLVDPGYAIVPRLLELIDAAEVDAVLVSHATPTTAPTCTRCCGRGCSPRSPPRRWRCTPGSPFGGAPASATPWQRRCTGAATAVAVSATRG
jgi:hypothetical protein